MNDLRHRWYKYKEGFNSDIVHKAINECNIKENDIIIDPFNGSGTVTLTASILGISSIGIEVNPFAAFLAKTKNLTPRVKEFDKLRKSVLKGAKKGQLSPLINFSTFSQKENSKKWLFNSSILNSFEGGWNNSLLTTSTAKELIKLALIGSALDNCNAVRDGKCFKYRDNWLDHNYGKTDFLNSLENRLDIIKEDINSSGLKAKGRIINGDSRIILKDNFETGFNLCITSPPYLNSFDYTDLYRPELFLGKFIKTNNQLQNLRTRTLRSHVETKLQKPIIEDFGVLYSEAINEIKKKPHLLWDKQIPTMIQGYFEDLLNIMCLLKTKALPNSNLWIIVSNSAYAGIEIPVDLIIGDIGNRTGWFLKEIEVIQYLKKRVTKNSPNIIDLRESIIKFSSNK